MVCIGRYCHGRAEKTAKQISVHDLTEGLSYNGVPTIELHFF